MTETRSDTPHAPRLRVPLTVVLAEDEALIAEDLAYELERNGIKVLARTRTCDETVAAVLDLDPAFVILDINLAQDTSGLEAAQRLRDHDGRRCIFLSGRLDGATRREVNALEPLAVLSKPFVTSALLEAITSGSIDTMRPAD